jgi:hypothetical protein
VGKSAAFYSFLHTSSFPKLGCRQKFDTFQRRFQRVRFKIVTR